MTHLCQETIDLTPEVYERYKEKIDDSILQTDKIADVRTMNFPKNEQKEPAKLEIIYEDVADAGYQLQKQGYNPVILNMASSFCPGGGWRKGTTAQEESLFYRSMYYLALEDPWKMNKNSLQYYPLQMYSAIYTPNVFFYRNKQLDGYKILPYEECGFISCLAIAAIRNPELNKDGLYRPSDRRVMIEKIKGIFKIALLKGHDSVVVSALGAGAYHNPPEQVAQIFREVIPEFRKYFKRITFAILDYRGSKNFEIFESILRKLN